MMSLSNFGEIGRRYLRGPAYIVMWAVSIFGALASLALLAVPRFFLPAEDVVILFQFSKNLAYTGAITFVTNGPHAEGATDVAWMVLIALGMKLGINAFLLITLVNAACLVLLSILLIRISGTQITTIPLLFIMGAFALMPQIFAAASGFSTLAFACLLVLMVGNFLHNNDFATPISSFVLCLFRPDGVVFAVPLLVAAFIIYPRRIRRLVLDVCLFVLPGAIYFLWRWRYFGQILPLPFLVK